MILFETHPPHPNFKDYIRCYWTLDRTGKGPVDEVHHAVPGGGLEIVFNISDPVECTVDDAEPIIFGGDFIIGSLARRVRIHPTGSMSLFAVRFTPGGLYPFFSMPPVDVSDFCVETEEVWELHGLGLGELIHGVKPTAERRIQAFENYFSRRMIEFRSHSPDVEKAVTMIRSHKGRIPVETLANRLDLGARRLERKFARRVGAPPKQLCRIFRFKNVLSNLEEIKRDPASLALECGYFDQAHFIHEFKFFSGQSPMVYLKNGV